MSDLDRMEIWETDEDNELIGTLAIIRTCAAPPFVGALINIRRVDYKVWKVDYSVDHPDFNSPQYRTNVYCRKHVP